MANNKPWASFEIEPADFDTALPLNDKDVKGYTIEVVKAKRTQKANQYLWVLCGQIADKAMMTAKDVYRRAVREAGLFDDLYMKEEAFDKFKAGWETKGIAWMVENDPPKNGWVTCRVYYGSSAYNSVEFSRLLDYIIDDAEFYGIETKSEDEINHMMDLWRREHGEV